MQGDANDTRPGLAGPDALDASVRLARLRRRMFARVEVPRIAQYHVMRKLGGGGMGLVFSAWDPSLDRLVAIKVLREPWSGEAGDQLRREAMALARLRHPVVVSVFEVGEHEGQVYLAMEYVEGGTLRNWVRQWRSDPCQDVERLLGVIEEVARGLAAAHEAGVVHRDVKPENIMIDADGRARLMDFGLARRSGSSEPTLDPTRSHPPFAVDQRSTAGFYGTPAYMAPEQLSGHGAGTGSDQFSLAACLYEALAGRSLREGSELEVQPSFSTAALRRCEPLLRQALAAEPSRRFESMDAFADALARLRAPSKRQTGLWVGGLIAALGLSVGFAVSRTDAPSACTGSKAHWDDIWDLARADGIDAGMAAPERPFAEETWSRVRGELDAYRAAWIEAHHSTCEAAHQQREISTTQLDLRMACLDDRLRRATAFVDLLEAQGPGGLASADQGLEALPPITDCRDPRYVGRQGYGERDPEAAQDIDRKLAEASALLASGASEAARDVALQAVELAQDQRDTPAHARALLAAGRSHARLYESSSAEARISEAYALARRAHLPDVATEAATALIEITGLDLSRFDEGLWWLRIADLEGADLERLDLDIARDAAGIEILQESGDNAGAQLRGERLRSRLREHPELDLLVRGRAELRLGWLAIQSHDPEGGRALLEQGAQRFVEVLGSDHPANARPLQELAFAARVRGDMAEAEAYSTRALALAESGVGPRHISLAQQLASYAMSSASNGKIEQGVAAYDRALALDDPRPLDAVTRAKMHFRKAEILSGYDPTTALQEEELAYELAREALGEQHRDTIQYLAGRGMSRGALGRAQEAREDIKTGLILAKAVLGSNHPSLAVMHSAFATELQRAGELEQALEHHSAALERFEASYGGDAHALIAPLVNLCGVLGLLERPREALPFCDRALAIEDARGVPRSLARPDIHNNRGMNMVSLKRYDDAAAEFERARQAWQEVLGPDTYEESITIANLGSVAEAQGDRDEAASRFAEAVRMREQALGPEHPAMQYVREGLARNQD